MHFSCAALRLQGIINLSESLEYRGISRYLEMTPTRLEQLLFGN